MTHTDIRRTGWVARMPVAVQPYLLLMRLDRPIGTWLLLLPGWWGLALAGQPWPDALLMVYFAIGAVIMRGAGCVVNDLWDREIDKRVERTRQRPLPSGAVTVPQALAFLAGLLLLGLLIALQFNFFTLCLGMASLVLIGVYPLMKRLTWWPQAFLGLTFNWGVLMGYAAATEELGAGAMVLYAGGVLWTLGYDTIYAHQDKVDDVTAGVKSLALRLGDASRMWIGLFYAGFFILAVMAGLLTLLGWAYFALLPLAALHAVWQVRGWQPDDPADCLRRFRSNRDFGLLVLLALVAGRLTA